MSDAIEDAGAEVGQSLAEGLNEGLSKMADERGWNDFQREQMPEYEEPDAPEAEAEVEAAPEAEAEAEVVEETPKPESYFFKQRKEARDDLRRELDELKAQLAQSQAPKPQPPQPGEIPPQPDWDEDPRGHMEWRLAQQQRETETIKQALIWEHQQKQAQYQQAQARAQEIAQIEQLEARASSLTADWAEARPGYHDKYEAVHKSIVKQNMALYPPEIAKRKIAEQEYGIILTAAQQNKNPGELVEFIYDSMMAGVGGAIPPEQPAPRQVPTPVDARAEASARVVRDGENAPISDGGAPSDALPSAKAFADGRVDRQQQQHLINTHGYQVVRERMAEARDIAMNSSRGG